MVASKEIRDWAIFVIAVIGFILTFRNFVSNISQRKLENALKMIDYMRKHITKEYLERIVELYLANNPLGSDQDVFILKNGEKQDVIGMFAEGGYGNGAVYNTMQVLELCASELNKSALSESIIWYEYGQIMFIINRWCEFIDNSKYGISEGVCYTKPNKNRTSPNLSDYMRKEKHHDYKRYVYEE